MTTQIRLTSNRTTKRGRTYYKVLETASTTARADLYRNYREQRQDGTDRQSAKHKAYALVDGVPGINFVGMGS